MMHMLSSLCFFAVETYNFLILGEARYVTGDLVLLQVTWKVVNHFGGFRFLHHLGRSCVPSCRSCWISTQSAAEIHHAPKASHSHQPPPNKRNSQQKQLTGNINVNVNRSRARMSARMWARMWTRTRRRQRRLTGGRKEPPIKCDEEKAAGWKVENAGGRRGRFRGNSWGGRGWCSQSVSEMKVLCD